MMVTYWPMAIAVQFTFFTGGQISIE